MRGAACTDQCRSQRTALEGEIATLEAVLADEREVHQYSVERWNKAEAALAALTAAHARVKAEYQALWLKEEQEAIDALARAEQAEAALAQLADDVDDALDGQFPSDKPCVARAVQQQRKALDAAQDALAVAKSYVTHKADCGSLRGNSHWTFCAAFSTRNLDNCDCGRMSTDCTCGAAAVLSQKGPSI